MDVTDHFSEFEGALPSIPYQMSFYIEFYRMKFFLFMRKIEDIRELMLRKEKDVLIDVFFFMLIREKEKNIEEEESILIR